MEATGPNAQQIEYWNDRAGESWVEAKHGLDALIEPLGRVGIERLALAPGGRIVFVCWQGMDRNPWVTETMAAVLRHVGPDGVQMDSASWLVSARAGR